MVGAKSVFSTARPEPGEVLRRRGTASRRIPEAKARPSRHLIRIRAERARRHELLIGRRDVEHRREVHVDAEVPELEAGRLALEARRARRSSFCAIVKGESCGGRAGRRSTMPPSWSIATSSLGSPPVAVAA